ncbi:MAG TPA: NAD(P)/FAD-dependent oxidoreductase, partial [Acidimicrobiales bacterium]|nr:NAD(P)/FAD-dependent oxidoreductase [Acidimicrobiales bacterium]
AAIVLARAGRDVVLVDKAVFPRDKCCGDGLTVAALRELERLGLRPESVPDWQVVDQAWVRGPTGRTVLFPLPEGRGQYSVCAPRSQLDAALLDVARAAGVKVYDGHGLTAARVRDTGIELDVEGLGPLVARFAIGADGMWSPLRKALGVAPAGYLGDWHAFRQYFSGVGTAASGLWVWFEPDLLPGYAWSFPLPGGRANVGFGIHRDGGIPTRDMKRMWPEILARPHIREVLGEGARPEGVHKAWPIPARVDDTPLTAGGGRALFVGDAACATDPMTGEGIAQALLSGRWAAEAILSSPPTSAGPDDDVDVGDNPDPATVAARYEKAVRRGLFADHRMSVRLSRTLSHRRGVNAALRLAGSSGWSRRHFGRWLFEDCPRAVLVTPRRWKRGTLSSPGAYERV